MSVPTNPRPDITWMRRRIRPGQAPAAAAAPAAAQQGTSLNLGRPSADTAAPPPASLSLRHTPAAAPSSLELGRPGAAAPAAAPQGASLSLGRTPAVQSPSPPPAAPAGQAPPRAPAGAQPSAGLVLGGAAPASNLSGRARKLAEQREKSKREDHEVQLLFAAPGIEDVYELNLTDRVLRLTPLQSSVGSLVVSGSTAVAWESVRRVAGGQTVDGHKAGTAVMTSGNRPLVGYHGRDALITLRHVRTLRRAIFINRSSSAMGVRLFSGQTVALPPAADGTQMVLLVHRVGNVLELRAEPVPHNWPDVQIWQEFDFSMTHSAPSSAYGR
ncbi:hypothetical protein JOF48_001560 [Arthrobacter stackebrandtii]|uniref:Uncharacterized protein n=1 Tax=Arthrobacter stackebrandtii TaxID=272161 RepID=A0ABS4YVG4_9MICC|nr:hypothetical protein [Arthrobacter stackebrandtii]MBP2412761.1 hypothetical protein [Arthrobacter stackebrandtii]PYG99882.1 hypothetical protein CVV67_12980 [Arthrobacter stackebrandtii]